MIAVQPPATRSAAQILTPRSGQQIGDEGSHGEHGAVAQVEQVGDAELQRKANRSDRQQCRGDETETYRWE